MTRSNVLVGIILTGLFSVAAPSVAGQRRRPTQTTASARRILPDFPRDVSEVMDIDGEIKKFTDEYDLDLDLAAGVVIHESGGNGRVVSIDGASGYFQVMPATFRSLRVDTNIEAGIKYLSQQVKRFGREDYAWPPTHRSWGRVTRRGLCIWRHPAVCRADQRLSQRAEANTTPRCVITRSTSGSNRYK